MSKLTANTLNSNQPTLSPPHGFTPKNEPKPKAIAPSSSNAQSNANARESVVNAANFAADFTTSTLELAQSKAAKKLENKKEAVAEQLADKLADDVLRNLDSVSDFFGLTLTSNLTLAMDGCTIEALTEAID